VSTTFWQQFDYALLCLSLGQNALDHISSLYQNNFLIIPEPDKTICAFISSLMLVPELQDNILHDIATKM
jgi:hypothetical protein